MCVRACVCVCVCVCVCIGVCASLRASRQVRVKNVNSVEEEEKAPELQSLMLFYGNGVCTSRIHLKKRLSYHWHTSFYSSSSAYIRPPPPPVRSLLLSSVATEELHKGQTGQSQKNRHKDSLDEARLYGSLKNGRHVS